MLNGPFTIAGKTKIYFQGYGWPLDTFATNLQKVTGLTPRITLHVKHLSSHQNVLMTGTNPIGFKAKHFLQPKSAHNPLSGLTLDNARFYLSITGKADDSCNYRLIVTGKKRDTKEPFSSYLILDQYSEIQVTSNITRVDFKESLTDHWGWTKNPAGILTCPLPQTITAPNPSLARFCEVARLGESLQSITFKNAWLDTDDLGTITGINIKYLVDTSQAEQVFNWPNNVGSPSEDS